MKSEKDITNHIVTRSQKKRKRKEPRDYSFAEEISFKRRKI